MSDRWWGFIEVEKWPAKWTTKVAAAAGATTFERQALNYDELPADLRDELSQIEFEDVDFDPETEKLTLSDSQLAGGSWMLDEGSGLAQTLTEHGFAWRCGDDGAYDSPGRLAWWRPGMAAPTERLAATEQGIVLALHDMRTLWTPNTKVLAERLAAYFDVPLDGVTGGKVTTS